MQKHTGDKRRHALPEPWVDRNVNLNRSAGGIGLRRALIVIRKRCDSNNAKESQPFRAEVELVSRSGNNVILMMVIQEEMQWLLPEPI
jgi:hypothetical protein